MLVLFFLGNAELGKLVFSWCTVCLLVANVTVLFIKSFLTSSSIFAVLSAARRSIWSWRKRQGNALHRCAEKAWKFDLHGSTSSGASPQVNTHRASNFKGALCTRVCISSKAHFNV
jgi:hypothetical protein